MMPLLGTYYDNVSDDTHNVSLNGIASINFYIICDHPT